IAAAISSKAGSTIMLSSVFFKKFLRLCVCMLFSIMLLLILIGGVIRSLLAKAGEWAHSAKPRIAVKYIASRNHSRISLLDQEFFELGTEPGQHVGVAAIRCQVCQAGWIFVDRVQFFGRLFGGS